VIIRQGVWLSIGLAGQQARGDKNGSSRFVKAWRIACSVGAAGLSLLQTKKRFNY